MIVSRGAERFRSLLRKCVVPVLLGSVLFAPLPASGVPGTNIVSGIAVREDGVVAAGAAVTLVTDMASSSGDVVASGLADAAGRFEVAVPATDAFVRLARGAGDELVLALTVTSLDTTGRAALTFEYTGQVVAALAEGEFVVANQVAPYLLRQVGNATVDLTPKTKVWLDTEDGTTIWRQTAAVPVVAQLTAAGAGSVPVTGPYRKTLTIAPDATQVAAEALNPSGGANGVVVPGIQAGAELGSPPTGECDPTGEGAAAARQYTPMSKQADPEDDSVELDYTVVPYERSLAHFRPDTAEWTWQVVLCGFGGTKSINGWRLTRAGMVVAVFLPTSPATPLRVGQSWDSENNDKKADASLDFHVDAGPANIGVTIPTGTSGTLEGSFGVRGPQLEDPSTYTTPNVVHAWWQAHWNSFVQSCCRGSRDFEAQVDEGIYEMGTLSQPTADAVLQTYQEVNCSTTKPCPLYN